MTTLLTELGKLREKVEAFFLEEQAMPLQERDRRLTAIAKASDAVKNAAKKEMSSPTSIEPHFRVSIDGGIVKIESDILPPPRIPGHNNSNSSARTWRKAFTDAIPPELQKVYDEKVFFVYLITYEPPFPVGDFDNYDYKNVTDIATAVFLHSSNDSMENISQVFIGKAGDTEKMELFLVPESEFIPFLQRRNDICKSL